MINLTDNQVRAFNNFFILHSNDLISTIYCEINHNLIFCEIEHQFNKRRYFIHKSYIQCIILRKKGNSFKTKKFQWKLKKR